MDRETFDRLMLEHLPAASRFAIRLTGDAGTAEDLLHDAVVRAAGARALFRQEASFRTWLFQILINAFRDSLRRRRPVEPLVEDAADLHSWSDPFRQASGEEICQLVARAVSTLPPRQREVVVLVVYEQMSPAEAAVVLGISEQNARTTLHHARQKLRQRLSPLLRQEDEREPSGRST